MPFWEAAFQAFHSASHQVDNQGAATSAIRFWMVMLHNFLLLH